MQLGALRYWLVALGLTGHWFSGSARSLVAVISEAQATQPRTSPAVLQLFEVETGTSRFLISHKDILLSAPDSVHMCCAE